MEKDKITYSIIGCAMKVHNTLGPGFQEVVYQRCLAIELGRAGLTFAREQEHTIFYDGIDVGTRRADFVVENKIVVELKALVNLEDVHLVACNAAGCDSVFFPAFINVLPTPPAPVITVSNDTLFASGPYSFAWYEVSNPAVVLGTDSFFVFMPPGSYYAIATDSNGCNVVSNVVNTGIAPLSPAEGVRLTPNPASDELTIGYAQYDKAAIRIMNTIGETVLGFELKAGSHKLNISALPNGIYFLQLTSKEHHFNKKFVVQR